MNFKCLPLFFGMALGAQVALASTVATIGSKSITVDEFKQRYNQVRQESFNAPSPEIFLEDLIRYEVGVQEAEKKGFQNDPLVKERFRQEMYKALVEKAIGNRVNAIKVSEKEMQDYYERNPDLRTAHILIEYKIGATPEEKEIARKRANEILSEVKASKREFTELARLYSDDVQTKNAGGDIGFQNRLTLVPAYYDSALKMKVGEVKGVIETRYGFHIVKLLERRKYDDLTDKRALRAAVFDQKRKVIFDDYFNKLKANYKISVQRDAIKNLKLD